MSHRRGEVKSIELWSMSTSTQPSSTEDPLPVVARDSKICGG
jgi:hypothetical protein